MDQFTKYLQMIQHKQKTTSCIYNRFYLHKTRITTHFYLTRYFDAALNIAPLMQDFHVSCIIDIKTGKWCWMPWTLHIYKYHTSWILKTRKGMLHNSLAPPRFHNHFMNTSEIFFKAVILVHLKSILRIRSWYLT